jgi:hypothetical protein
MKLYLFLLLLLLVLLLLCMSTDSVQYTIDANNLERYLSLNNWGLESSPDVIHFVLHLANPKEPLTVVSGKGAATNV